MKIHYLLLPVGILFVVANPVVGAETPTDLVVDVYAKQPKAPKISGYGRPAKQIAQGTAHIKGKDAAKTGSDRLEDFADYVPGVQVGDGTGTGSVINIRGFRAYQANLDGLPDVEGAYLRDPATLEAVDIAKGRDSTLFGFGTPGGTVGYTSKKPSFTPKRTLSLLMGAPSQIRGLLDITGALRGQEWAGRPTCKPAISTPSRKKPRSASAFPATQAQINGMTINAKCAPTSSRPLYAPNSTTSGTAGGWNSKPAWVSSPIRWKTRSSLCPV
ncbi:MAG: hypothetical protein BWK73_06075 [Thiothrix lacustris]|uniref:TonB-dependent receptor plug domain-containing protein n=1 Tax=Thiothrix lacustris TaxID=525917 RepID=A0A1Y1QWR7_9GAMM|nr:MAG: hypothetical protein BWK73_06075 [Thiothrix lacustris]